jgi:hypothetical protein
MGPATGQRNVSKLSVAAVAVCLKVALKPGKKSYRVFSGPGGLVVIQDKWR